MVSTNSKRVSCGTFRPIAAAIFAASRPTQSRLTVPFPPFGYEYGQLPGCPAGFKADDKLIAAAEACIAELNLNAVRGLIVSGDAFINGSVGLAKIRHNFPQAIAVEMEATAIAHVCHNFNVPFVVVRAISDVADQQSHLSFDEFLAVAAKQSSLMVESLVQKLAHG